MEHMFGYSIFGSDAGSAPDPTRSRTVGEGSFPITDASSRTVGLSPMTKMTQVIGNLAVGVGSRVPEATTPVSVTTGARVPVQRGQGRLLRIGPGRDPRIGVSPEQLFLENPGIFHRPSYVGSGRYSNAHPGGVPSLGLYGYQGFGSPDGLIGYGG